MNCANHPDRERKAFCQNCGKPLCAECARTVGQAVFCEPCLEMRLAAANAASGAGPFAGTPAGSPPFGSATGYASVPPSGIPYPAAGVPPPPGTPNPGIAFALGFCPGVGAMYNGQYAKGVVHLIVFAVLVSLADQNGIFGIFVAAWIFYQAFEAYHTARARVDGTALPNPFGLNDIGERLGFGRSWPGGPSSSVPPPPPSTGGSDFTSSSPSQAASAQPDIPVSETPFTYTNPSDSGAAYRYVDPAAADRTASWGAPVDSYSSPYAPLAPAPVSRFPTGALVLIGLGVLFLLGSTRLLVGFPMRFLLPFLLIGVGVYIFIQRMGASGTSLVDDGTSTYRLRLVRALQSSIWIMLVGVLFLLDTLHILDWGRSWPLFIIVGGIMAFVRRSAYTASIAQPPYPSWTPGPVPPAPQSPPAATTDPGTSIVPRDREGS